MLKQGLHQQQLQKLSPQQIQLMRLLQVPVMQLEQRIKEELEENPALEEVETVSDISDDNLPEENDFDINDYLDEGDIADYKLRSNNYASDEEKHYSTQASGTSFYDYLSTQFSAQYVSEKEQQIAEMIIGNLDQNGYLKREIAALSDDLAFMQNVHASKEEILHVLYRIQELDPPGIAARDLQECLQIQLKRMTPQTTAIYTALQILTKCYDAFIKRHFIKIQDKLKISENELQDALTVISQLNPKPGNALGDSENDAPAVIPDYFLTNHNGRLELTLNSKNDPELRVNGTYREMLQTYSETPKKSKEQKDAVYFIRHKIEAAKGFIDAVKQRRETLLNTMQAILNMQQEYFQTGEMDKLKPMKLKDIADVVSLDVSTISRVVNSKYIQTPFGIFSLKDFFSQSFTKEEGEDVSVNEIKILMEKLISEEDKRHPLNDDKLTELLAEKGFRLARRTVAKYRETMQIPVARMRKQV